MSIQYTGVTSGYFGPSTQSLASVNQITVGADTQFTETITLTDSATFLSHSINSISVETPGFALISVAPSTPITLAPGSSVTITLTIQAPSSAYNGPLQFGMSTS